MQRHRELISSGRVCAGGEAEDVVKRRVLTKRRGTVGYILNLRGMAKR